jgi:hypothetical protein
LRAQALGDEQALKDAGRRVLSIALEGDHAKSIKELTQSLVFGWKIRWLKLKRN